MSLSHRLLQHILHCELKFHPYKIMITQTLYKRDFAHSQFYFKSDHYFGTTLQLKLHSGVVGYDK